MPIALGESFFTSWQVASWVSMGALHVLQPDVCRTGFSDGLRQQALAEAAGIKVTAHMGSGSPIVQAATLQFDAALPGDLLAEYQFDLSGVLPDVFQSNWGYWNGIMTVPDRSGLGVRVDEAALVRHCALVERWTAG